jgi:hypothetical protein
MIFIWRHLRKAKKLQLAVADYHNQPPSTPLHSQLRPSPRAQAPSATEAAVSMLPHIQPKRLSTSALDAHCNHQQGGHRRQGPCCRRIAAATNRNTAARHVPPPSTGELPDLHVHDLRWSAPPPGHNPLHRRDGHQSAKDTTKAEQGGGICDHRPYLTAGTDATRPPSAQAPPGA